ncbi:MAG: hypothetical protein IJ708_00320 [Clostridia bacterium]|nr:hypothetical protein [Clostridia bacterium]
MSRTKLLFNLVQDIRSVAESLEAIAAAIADDDAQAETPTAQSATQASTINTEPVKKAPDEPPLDLVALRSYVASKAPTKEQKLQVKAILNKRGYAKITELPEAEYAAFKQEVDALV